MARHAKTCLTPGCSGEITTRGLCSSCYQGLAARVREGRTTWGRLEAAGLCLPAFDERSSANPAVRLAAELGAIDAAANVPPAGETSFTN